MVKTFNYEDIFMGVMQGKQESYLRTFKDDYRLKRLGEFVNKKQKGRILDIGCGGGITTESLQYYYPSATYYGCDVSAKAIGYARQFGSGKVKYAVIRGKKLPYKNKYFDLCICLDVMEHVPDVDFFLEEVKRILKKDGKFFLLVPCEGQQFTHTWLWQKLHIGSTMTFRRYGHIHPEFTHEFVIQKLREHGFSTKKKSYSEHFMYQLISLFTYFIPLEIMDAFLGKKAKAYSDSGVIKTMHKRKNTFDPLIFLRTTWLSLIRFFRESTLWELDMYKNSSFTAWKLIVLAQKNK